MQVVKSGVTNTKWRNSKHSLVMVLFLFCWFVCGYQIKTILALPPGFRDEGVMSEKQSVGFNFVPSKKYASRADWLLLTTRKKGQVVAILDPDKGENNDAGTNNHESQKVVVLDIEDKVCSTGERGVFQVLPHPNFLENNYVYVFFTYDLYGGCGYSPVDGAVNAVARYRLKGHGYKTGQSQLRMLDEKIIFMSNPLPSKVHNGGDMKFGHDGNLYITLGNGGMSSEYGNAEKTNTLLGSIIRITDDGGIPFDNPFQDTNDRPCGMDGNIALTPESGGRCSEIWAYGFRNPYRFALAPNNEINSTETTFYINDVGGSFFEEINRVTSSHGGLNYGYREREGPCSRMTNDGCSPDPRYVDPIFWYEHIDRTDASVTGGAFVPEGIWPESYTGRYLFADFIFRTISILSEEDPSKACRECSPPIPAFSQEHFTDTRGQPLQLTFGPYKGSQALYYSLWGPEDEFSIRRIIYVGQNAGNSNNDIDDNKGDDEKEQMEKEEDDNNHIVEDYSAPIANIQIEGEQVVKWQNFGIDEVIVFDALESTDPDGDDLSYSWNFGDGSVSTKDVQAHAFTTAGEYRVKLTVQNSYGFIDTISKMITVGSLPEPSIVVPWENFEFAVGDELTLFGTAVDADGNNLDDSYLTWEVRKIHNTHYHPFLDPTIGNLVKIPPAPSPEDLWATTNSFLQVLLTATDPRTNLTKTVVRDVMPKTKTLYFTTDPPGLELTLDGFDIKTPDEAGVPLEVVTWINHNFTTNVKDQGDMVFKSWSDGFRERYSKNVVRQYNVGRVTSRTKTAIFVPSSQKVGLSSMDGVGQGYMSRRGINRWKINP